MFLFIVGEREVIALFLKDKTKQSLLCKTNIIIIILFPEEYLSFLILRL